MKAKLVLTVLVSLTVSGLLAQNRPAPPTAVPDQPAIGAPGLPGLPGGQGGAGGIGGGIRGGGFGGAPGGIIEGPPNGLPGGAPGSIGIGAFPRPGGGGGLGGFPGGGGLGGGGFPGHGGGFNPGHMPMPMPTMDLSVPGRYELVTTQIVPDGKKEAQPIILKIDTQTGQVWRLKSKASPQGITMEFVAINQQGGHGVARPMPFPRPGRPGGLGGPGGGVFPPGIRPLPVNPTEPVPPPPPAINLPRPRPAPLPRREDDRPRPR